jgi:hypothetical protein
MIDREDAIAARGEQSEIRSLGYVIAQHDRISRIVTQYLFHYGSLKVARKLRVRALSVAGEITPAGRSAAQNRRSECTERKGLGAVPFGGQMLEDGRASAQRNRFGRITAMGGSVNDHTEAYSRTRAVTSSRITPPSVNWSIAWSRAM